MSGAGATPVVALVVDLMDRSKVSGATDRAVTFVARAGAIAPAVESGATLVVVDLGRPDALEAVATASAAGCRVLAYGSHVDRERLDAAHGEGAEVLARSAFFARLAELLD